MSDVPAIAETVPGFDVVSWFGFFVPAKTPKEIVAKINADTNAALVMPAGEDALRGTRRGAEGLDGGELAAFLKSETDKWGPVIKDAQIKLDN